MFEGDVSVVPDDPNGTWSPPDYDPANYPDDPGEFEGHDTEEEKEEETP